MNIVSKVAAGFLALAFIGTASADPTYIRITGAQGLRGAVHAGIGHILKQDYTVGYQGTTLSTATQAVFSGTTTTGYPVIIKTSFGTSTNGIRTMVKNLPINTWLADSCTGPNQTVVDLSNTTADVTVSGEFQSTTRFPTPALTDSVIGVFPYVWVRNAGSPATLSNINCTLAKSVFAAGATYLSQFTGLPADWGVLVTLIGRDEGASSRECLFAESGFGIYSSPTQSKLAITSGTVTGVDDYPAQVVDDVPYLAGHSGYQKFTEVVAALNFPGSLEGTGGWVIGYSDIVDAAIVNPGVVATAVATVSSGTVASIAVTKGGTNYNNNPIITISGGSGSGATAVANVSNGVITGITVTKAGSGYTGTPTVSVTGGALMNWNGFAYSTTAVEQGQYTYWSYAHLMYRSTLADPQKTIAKQLAKQIHDVDIAVGGNSLLKNMTVGRSGDGTPVTPGNPYP